MRPPGESQRLHQPRRALDAPQRVAQVLGDREDVGEQPGAVDRGDVVAARASRGSSGHQNRIAPSGIATCGKTRTPRVSTLSAPTVTPSPRTAPPVIVRARADLRAGGDDAVAQLAVLADLGALQTTERSIARVGADADAVAEDDERADVRALGDRAAALDDRGRDDAPARLDVVADDDVVAPSRSVTAVCTLPSMMSNVPWR